jgi:protocatechuate 3,4-dioxygenase beta subunit
MKLAACLLIAAFLLCGQQPPSAQCFVSGRILNAANGEPVRRARLILRLTDNSTGEPASPAAYTTLTDDHGRFAMKDIEPGNYRLSVSHAGFSDLLYAARRPYRDGIALFLDAGQQLTGMVFRMTPHAVITGRILDAEGDPIQDARVTADRYRYITGKRQLVPVGYATTDDQGEYRLFGLAPGRYYVEANPRNSPTLRQVAHHASKPVEESYVQTYYPGATDIGNATVIELAPGTQVRGMDFALSKALTVSVRGHVNTPQGVNRQTATIMLTPRARSVLGPDLHRVHVVDRQGTFEIAGLSPGSYILTASMNDGKTSYLARQQVDVGGNSIEDLALSLSLGSELAGELRFEGQAPPSLTGIGVGLVESERYEGPLGARPYCEVKEDGTFTLPNIASEIYRPSAHGLPAGYYLKSVRIGDDELKEKGIDATREISGTLLLTVSSNSGQIEGAVTDAKQKPVPGATVVLVPEPRKRERYEAFQQVTTDQQGRYALKTVEPGEYKLFAWEDIESEEYMDPEFLKPVEARGSAISIHEGSRESADLQLIPAKPPAK